MSTRSVSRRSESDDSHNVRIPQAEVGNTDSEIQPQLPIPCHICQRTYTRSDHLARHLRTHTQEKPFMCEVCQKSFSRIDVLKRHHQNHSSVEPNKRLRTSRQSTQHRVSRACGHCAEAKLKCSESRPCERCVGRGLVCKTANLQSQLNGRAEVSISDSNLAKGFSVPSLESGFSADVTNYGVDTVGSSMNNVLQSDASDSAQNQIDSVDMAAVFPPPTLLDGQHLALGLLSPQALDLEISRNFHDYMMVNFLSDITNPEPFDLQSLDHNTAPLPDILDFAFDDSFMFASTEPSSYHVPSDGLVPRAESGTITPIHKLASLGEQAFKESMWQWVPAHGDSTAAEQANLSLPTSDLIGCDPTGTVHRLSAASRDRVLSLILRTCERSVQAQVVTCFPSADMLSTLLTAFTTHQSNQFAPWIHIPSLDIDREREEFILAMVASGASISPHSNVRKLGYAMQEALRHSIPEVLESDNRNTRELRISQAYAMQLQIGLWSGNRRKMEIAESFAYPLVTMLRRGARFRRTSLKDIIPKSKDDSQTLESKWKRWIEYESFKRLAYQLFLMDTGISFSLMNQPLLSYAEIHLDLPCSQAMWRALNAQEWRAVYQNSEGLERDGIPGLRSALEDLSVMTKCQSNIDVQVSLAIVVSTLWSRVWQCLQMKASSSFHTSGSGGSNMLTVNTLYQELVHAAKNISLRSMDWSRGLGPYAELLLELCLLHLHVSLEAVQLLAGKDGEEEARRAVPILRHWIKSPESRQAVYHAGRILHAARQFPFGHLRDHTAVAVYHAGLALWAFAVLSSPSLHLAEADNHDHNGSIPRQEPAVILDHVEGPEMQRFLVLGTGSPAIRKNEPPVSASHTTANVVLLSDTSTAMKSVANLLTSKNGDEQQRSPMIGNLIKLILALGKASSELKKKGR